MALRCEAGFVYCREVAASACSICGRYFCAKHGDPAGPYCRHCRRAFLADRRAEAAEAAEVTRREVAGQHNAAQQCGWVACEGPMLALCEHCGLQYCSLHSSRYRYSYRYRSRRGV